jgi:hypothetical protein
MHAVFSNVRSCLDQSIKTTSNKLKVTNLNPSYLFYTDMSKKKKTKTKKVMLEVIFVFFFFNFKNDVLYKIIIELIID